MPTRGSVSAPVGRPAREHGLGEQQVERAGHLERLLGAGDDDAPGRRPLDQPGVVGRLGRHPAPPYAARAPPGGSPAGSAPRAAPTGRRWPPRRPSPSTCLTVSTTGEPGHDGVRTGPDGRDHRVDERARHQRPGRVVHEHDVHRVGQRRQRPPYRLLPGVAARDDRELGTVVRRRRARPAPPRRVPAARPPRRGRPAGAPARAPRAPASARRRAGAAPWRARARAAHRAGSRHHGRDDRVPVTAASAAGRANTIRPFAVVRTLVTRTCASWPTGRGPARRRPWSRRRGSRRPGPAPCRP